ncbi:MAG: hypothetical protein MI924_37195 [Chloroflexales bacterium]|nr:hypothetical protein [Chloroflexales bacterium]
MLTFGDQSQFGAMTVGDMAGGDLAKGAVTIPGAMHGAAVGVTRERYNSFG